MFNLDPGKLIVIAVVAIILLGPDKLPQVARQVGGAWRSFGEFRRRMESEVRSTMPDLPSTTELARLARSPTALLHHLSTMSEQEEEEAAAAASAAANEADAADSAEAVGAVNATAGATQGPGDGGHTGEVAPATWSSVAPSPATDGGVHDVGTNGSGPAASASPAEPLQPPPEPVVQADPNLN